MSIKKWENRDWLFKQLFKGTGLLTIVLLGGIFIMLLYNSIAFFINIKPLYFYPKKLTLDEYTFRIIRIYRFI